MTKTFILCSQAGSEQVRQSLLARGWKENKDTASSNFDFKWALNVKDLNLPKLQSHHKVNHFKEARSITTKSGLVATLRNLPFFASTHPDTFFPRCYNLSEEGEMQAFEIDFKRCAAASVLRTAMDHGGLHPKGVPDTATVMNALTVCNAFLRWVDYLVEDEVELSMLAGQKDEEGGGGGDIRDPNALPDLSKKQWKSILECPCFMVSNKEGQEEEGDIGDEDEDVNNNTISKKRPESKFQKMPHQLERQVREALSALSDSNRFPWWPSEGVHNAWVLKPSGLSRGRNIRVFNLLHRIKQHMATESPLAVRDQPMGEVEGNLGTSGQESNGGAGGKITKAFGSHVPSKREGREDQEGGIPRSGKSSCPESLSWIVQRYIERPLCPLGRKMDIRQWVLVTDWEPLTVWFYRDCYIRFAAEDYALDDFANVYMHLTNNSVAKHSAQFERSQIGTGNMWFWEQMDEYLGTLGHKTKWEDQIVPDMKRAVKLALMSAQGSVETRKNSFELYGFDFLLDTKLNVWLLEVNSSPTLEHSTEVTTKLCPAMVEDLIKVVVDMPARLGIDVERETFCSTTSSSAQFQDTILSSSSDSTTAATTPSRRGRPLSASASSSSPLASSKGGNKRRVSKMTAAGGSRATTPSRTTAADKPEGGEKEDSSEDGAEVVSSPTLPSRGKQRKSGRLVSSPQSGGESRAKTPWEPVSSSVEFLRSQDTGGWECIYRADPAIFQVQFVKERDPLLLCGKSCVSVHPAEEAEQRKSRRLWEMKNLEKHMATVRELKLRQQQINEAAQAEADRKEALIRNARKVVKQRERSHSRSFKKSYSPLSRQVFNSAKYGNTPAEGGGGGEGTEELTFSDGTRVGIMMPAPPPNIYLDERPEHYYMGPTMSDEFARFKRLSRELPSSTINQVRALQTTTKTDYILRMQRYSRQHSSAREEMLVGGGGQLGEIPESTSVEHQQQQEGGGEEDGENEEVAGGVAAAGSRPDSAPLERRGVGRDLDDDDVDVEDQEVSRTNSKGSGKGLSWENLGEKADKGKKVPLVFGSTAFAQHLEQRLSALEMERSLNVETMERSVAHMVRAPDRNNVSQPPQDQYTTLQSEIHLREEALLKARMTNEYTSTVMRSRVVSEGQQGGSGSTAALRNEKGHYVPISRQVNSTYMFRPKMRMEDLAEKSVAHHLSTVHGSRDAVYAPVNGEVSNQQEIKAALPINVSISPKVNKLLMQRIAMKTATNSLHIPKYESVLANKDARAKVDGDHPQNSVGASKVTGDSDSRRVFVSLGAPASIHSQQASHIKFGIRNNQNADLALAPANLPGSRVRMQLTEAVRFAAKARPSPFRSSKHPAFYQSVNY